MRISLPLLSAALVLLFSRPAHAYIEVPHSLGQCVKDSTNVVLMEVTRVNVEKGMIIFKKVEDLKGKHNEVEIKHNIGKRGFHPREWQNVMQWAEVGKKAVFFHNGGASETCIGTYWYQCYKEGEWWGMSHAEPFLLRTFYGEVDKLVPALQSMLKGEEVIVTCLADGNKNELHLRKGKLQMMKASLKRVDYNVKRDFVGFGGDAGDIVEFKTTVVMAESSPNWKFIPYSEAAAAGERWKDPNFDDKGWRSGKAPIGYGEEELQKRNGTIITEAGVSFLFRKEIDIPAEILSLKNATFRLNVASDDNATVYINGQLADQDPEPDHEPVYWNREVEVPIKLLKPGKNLIAALVKNKPGSSDLFLDMEFSAQVPLPKKKPDNPNQKPTDKVNSAQPVSNQPEKIPDAVVIDKDKKTVAIPCIIAPRKLPNLAEIYPLEVVATYPAPKGQKAHETIVIFSDFKPSHVHRALEQLGLKPGKPAKGEGAKAEGPEVKIYLEVPTASGQNQRIPIEKTMVDRKTGKPLPPLIWRFTGSAMKQPDPEKDDKVFGADLTGTLISIFPVTDDTVFQTNLTMKEESLLKLEIAKDSLPKEGTAVKLIIEVK